MAFAPGIFGQGTDVPNYETLKKRRQIADLLAARSIATTPRNLGEGIASIGQAIAGRVMDRKLVGQEEAARKSVSDILAGIVGGGGYGGGGYSGDPSTMGPPMFAPGAEPPAGAPVAPTASNPYASPELSANPIYQGLLQRGLSDPVAQGFMMNFQDESGLNPAINEQNPTVPGSRGGFGLAQWTGPRRQALEQYALESGKPVDDPNTQLDFLMTELQGSEKGAAASFMGATDPGQAGAAIATNFLRPAAENLAPRVAEYTGGGGYDLSAALGGHEPDMAKVSQLAQVLGNPYADEGQKMVAKALIERELVQADPMTAYQMAQLGMDAKRLALDTRKAEDGFREGVQSFGNVYYAEKDDPNTPENEKTLSPYVTNKKGEVQWLDLGEGVTPLPPTQNLNLGTYYQPMGPGGNPTGQPQAIDNTGKAAETELGQAAGKAAAGLGDQGVMVEAAISRIDEILGDKALPEVLGNWQGRLPPRTQAQANVQAKIEGLQSQVFANAIKALVGLGAMSNMEGQSAAQSLAALAQIQDDKQYAGELGRLKQLLLDKYEAAKSLAAQGAAPSGGATSTPKPAGFPLSQATWDRLPPEDQEVWK